MPGQGRAQPSELASPPTTLICCRNPQRQELWLLGGAPRLQIFLITFPLLRLHSQFCKQEIFLVIQINSCKISPAVLSEYSCRDDVCLRAINPPCTGELLGSRMDWEISG